MSHKSPRSANDALLQLGIHNDDSPPSVRSRKKPYFREKELFSKAVDMNLNNNLRIKYCKEVPKYYWRVNRADVLRDYKLGLELATMRDNLNKSVEETRITTKRTATPGKTSRSINKSVCASAGKTPTKQTMPSSRKPVPANCLPKVTLKSNLTKRLYKNKQKCEAVPEQRPRTFSAMLLRILSSPLCLMASSIKPAMRVISRSFMPRVVTAGVPTLMPLVTMGG